MSELDFFLEWLEDPDTHKIIKDSELDVQLSAFTRTFPGRTLELLEELAKAAIDRRREEET